MPPNGRPEKLPSPEIVYFIAAGRCTVNATVELSEEYSPTTVQQTFLVAKTTDDQITFTTSAPTHATVGGSYEPAVRSSAGVLPWITSATLSVCEVLGGKSKALTFIAPGTCTIEANQAADVNEEPGPNESAASQSFTVYPESRSQRKTAESIPPSVRAELLKYARYQASASGDSEPYDVEAVRTTHGRALALRGVVEHSVPEEASDTPVYVLAMRGEFHYNGPAPPEAAIPAETVIMLETLATNPISFTGRSEGWSNSYPKLRKLGTPVRLEAAKHGSSGSKKNGGKHPG